MQPTDTFTCALLNGSMSYLTCIKRQSVAKVQYYLDCVGCAQGAEIVAQFVPRSMRGKIRSKQANRWAYSGKSNTTSAKRQMRKRMALHHAQELPA